MEEKEKTSKPPSQVDRESRDSGIVSPAREEIVKEHIREHPEGDPAVRRIRPDHGEIPIEEEVAPGIVRVYEKKGKSAQKKDKSS